jgi:hypothetical protein
MIEERERSEQEWGSWKPTTENVVADPRDIDYLTSKLNLPAGLTLVPRPGTRLDGSMNFAIVTNESNADVVLFELSMMFYANQIDLLIEAVTDALNKAKETGETQRDAFRDPNEE